MLNEKHDLLHELPEHRDSIHKLKMTNTHFSQLFDEYHIVNNEIHRIESGIENTADDYLEQQKKRRLQLKDKLYRMIQNS